MNNQWWAGLSNLDDDQRKVLGLDASGRYYVTGPAGCGKTNLLVLRARYLAKRGVENYAVLVFNATLERFLTSNPTYGVASDKVHTFVSWLEHQYWTLIGSPNGIPEEFNARRAFLRDGMKAHLDQTGVKNVVDTILVDEIQDYSADEIAILGQLGQNLFFVGDVRQQIWQPGHLAAAIDKVILKSDQIELTKHYRIGHAICRLADRIAKPQKGHRLIFDGCCYDEAKQPSTVRKVQGALALQLEEAAKTIADQVDAYPGEYIGVICPRNATLDEVSNFLDKRFPKKTTIQRSGEGYQNFDVNRPIVCSSLHNSKGLEYRCAHILGADGLENMPRNRELIYTGVTRAKTSLVIYHDDKLMGYLADALVAGDPPLPEPPPESLFE